MTKNIQIYSPFDVDMDNQGFDWINFKTEYDKQALTVKDLIFNLKTAFFLKDQIAVKFNLNERQSTELSRIVRDVLITKIILGEIIEEIKNRLAVDENIAKEISNKILNDLFAPALEEIKKLRTEKFGSATSSWPIAKPEMPPQMKSDEKVNPNNVLDLRKKDEGR